MNAFLPALWLMAGLSVTGPSNADTAFEMSSTSEQARYGLLVVSDPKCAQSKVSVQSAEAVWRSTTLGPGEIVVVKMGRGFAVGQHRLTVNSHGCEGKAYAARTVVLGKQSPDHGWRSHATLCSLGRVDGRICGAGSFGLTSAAQVFAHQADAPEK